MLAAIIGGSLGGALLLFGTVTLLFTLSSKKKQIPLKEPTMVRTYSVGNLANRMTVYQEEGEEENKEVGELLEMSEAGDRVSRYLAGRSDMGFLER